MSDQIVEINTTIEGTEKGHEVIHPHGWFLNHVEEHTPILHLIALLQQDDPNLSDEEARILIREAQQYFGWTKARLVPNARKAA